MPGHRTLRATRTTSATPSWLPTPPSLTRLLGLRPLTSLPALALALALTLAAWPVAGAQADVGTQIIERCTNGKSIAGYTQQDYRRALEEMTAEVNEYSPCPNQIHQAQLAAAGRGRSGASGGAAAALTANVPPPTPAEQQTLQSTVHSTGSKPVSVGNESVVPGVVHANIASAVNSLPTPLLALLAFLLVGALSILARAIRERVRTRRHD